MLTTETRISPCGSAGRPAGRPALSRAKPTQRTMVKAGVKPGKRKLWKLRIGSHCSGWETITMAARAIGVPGKSIDLKFSSDIDPHCREVIRQNNPGCKNIYEDVTQVDHNHTPNVDIFTAGIPCQPFSGEGARLGTTDKRGRIGTHCIDYILTQRPKCFILENVPRFVAGRNQVYFRKLMNKLACLVTNSGDAFYTLEFAMLNTLSQGLPQSRKRFYIVGIATTHMTKDFTFPPEIAPVSAESLLDPPVKNALRHPEWPTSTTRLVNLHAGLEKIQKAGGDPWKEKHNTILYKHTTQHYYNTKQTKAQHKQLNKLKHEHAKQTLQ
jgi:DNA-cytosine methyltransferase